MHSTASSPPAQPGALALRPDPGYRALHDDELRRRRREYQRALVLVEEDVAAAHGDLSPDELAERIAGGRAWYAQHLGECEREEARRERAAQLGVPRDADRYPPEFLDDLKRRVKLDELVEDELGATLGRASAKGVRCGRCPFHEDHDPSFYVYTAPAAGQHFHCYGCGTHGDAIDAITIARRLDFREAVASLARDAGLALPAPARPAAGHRVVRLMPKEVNRAR
jgi:hypothetical protein